MTIDEQPQEPTLARRQVVELRTECAPEGVPVSRCALCGHTTRVGTDPRAGHDRVVVLAVGEHVWFGSEDPRDGRPWLQVGPAGPFRTPREKVVSSVCGQVWVSEEAGGTRVMVENLSTRVTLEIRSPRLPSPVVLYPVDDADPDRRRWLGTPIAAVQADHSSIALVNQSDELTIAVSVDTDDWGPRREPLLTRDPRTHWEASGRRPARKSSDTAERRQTELYGAVRRITLGASAHTALLEDFLDLPAVRDRLDASATLTDYLSGSKHAGWPTFAEAMLDRVRADQPTHELHRLIMAGLGEPQEHPSRYYTDLVRDQLHPQREVGSVVGGGGGFAELVPQVRGLWRLRPGQLREYLGTARERDRSPERDLGRGRGV